MKRDGHCGIARLACTTALLLVAAGCSPRQLGLPRVALAVASPDGGTTAWVRNHVELDPPSQSLWLRSADGDEIQLRRLAPDQDWCDTIVWSADGSRVAFLVQQGRLLVADVTGRVVVERWLVPSPRGSPPRERVEELALSPDGSRASFRRCSRTGSGCSEPESLAL